jgi:cell division septal protein FtsQ
MNHPQPQTPDFGRSPRGIRRPSMQRLRASTRQRRDPAFQVSVFVVACALVCGLLWFGISRSLDKFFFQNPAYNLVDLDLELDGLIAPEDFRRLTGVECGKNIFRLDLVAVDAALRGIPTVQNVSVERELPGRLSVRLSSRHAVARVDEQGREESSAPLLVDDTGFLMRPLLMKSAYHSLPVLQGVRVNEVRQGRLLESDDLGNALALLREMRARPAGGFPIESLDISKGYCLDATMADGVKVKFAAGGFPSQLDKLDRLLAHCRETGRQLVSVNLMVTRNTPVVFAMAEPPPPPAKAPSKKTKPSKPNVP